ncbi:MAG: bifunctional metallophosphatase/5'-nucleotidase [Akkermansia sp.]|nr:bifunctional metallophosphatase/5'-nucleotidase [Akkermansia sp.]
MKKSVFLSLLIMLGSAFAEQVTILGVNDMHANIDGMPQLATCVKQERLNNPGLLLMAAGDSRTGNPYVDNGNRPGIPMVTLMNHVGFDLSTFGNHEFDSGTAALRDYVNTAEFDFVCANIFTTDTQGINVKPYKIFERNGVRIGVLGLVQVGETGIPDAHPDKCKGLQFASPFDTAACYKHLRSFCDVLIVLTHLGFEDDVKLAQMFPEADAIIGGHSHTRVEKEHLVNGVLITQSENKLKFVTRLTFDVENGKVISKKSELLPLTDLPDDAATEELVEKTKSLPFFKRQLTTVKRKITRRESLGCMMADAISNRAVTDIAIVNLGGVRLDDFPAGPLTVADVYRLDPFGNAIIRATLTGKELIALIESIPQADHYGAPCVSGMTYKCVKPSAELKPMRVTEAKLADGTPINPEARYTVAYNSYIASVAPAKPADAGIAIDSDGAECLIRFLEKKKEVDYEDTSRVDVTIAD